MQRTSSIEEDLWAMTEFERPPQTPAAPSVQRWRNRGPRRGVPGGVGGGRSIFEEEWDIGDDEVLEAPIRMVRGRPLRNFPIEERPGIPMLPNGSQHVSEVSGLIFDDKLLLKMLQEPSEPSTETTTNRSSSIPNGFKMPDLAFVPAPDHRKVMRPKLPKNNSGKSNRDINERK